MADGPSEEPQHMLGMPIAPGRTFPRVDPTEQRAFGMPLSWYRANSVDFSGCRHPIRWIKWRANPDRDELFTPDRTDSTEPQK
jgi:hypothetical protein